MVDLADAPIIYFEGLDRTGKSSTRIKFAQATNQKYITFDRGILSNLVYDEMFRGKVLPWERIKTLVERFNRLQSTYFVYLSLSNNEINRRAKETEGIEHPIGELIACEKLFTKYIKAVTTLGLNVTTINCDGKTLEEVVEEVKRIKFL